MAPLVIVSVNTAESKMTGPPSQALWVRQLLAASGPSFNHGSLLAVPGHICLDPSFLPAHCATRVFFTALESTDVLSSSSKDPILIVGSKLSTFEASHKLFSILQTLLLRVRPTPFTPHLCLCFLFYRVIESIYKIVKRIK